MSKRAKSKAKVKEHHPSAAISFLMGRAVEKEFKGFGTFKGRVTDFHSETGDDVDYEDGDSEDFSEGDLVRHSSPVAAVSLIPCVLTHMRVDLLLVPSHSAPQLKSLATKCPLEPVLEFEAFSNMSKRTAPPSTTLQRVHLYRARNGEAQAQTH